MIKKRYLMILSVAIVSIMLGSMFYSNITQALRGKEPVEVEVTNFPLDEEGNLKVSTGATSKVITVVKDLNLSWISHPSTLYWTDLIEVEGYSESYVYVNIRNWTEGFDLNIYQYASVDGIEANIPMESGTRSRGQSEPSTGSYNSTMTSRFLIWAPQIRLCISVHDYGWDTDGWLLVSVSLYLRN